MRLSRSSLRNTSARATLCWCLDAATAVRGAAVDAYASHLRHLCYARTGLSEEMYDDGFLNLINIDISKTAIRMMAARTADRRSMRWEVMSCTALTLSDASVDAVLDKGTMDSLLCGENSGWLEGLSASRTPHAPRLSTRQALPTCLRCARRCRECCGVSSGRAR